MFARVASFVGGDAPVIVDGLEHRLLPSLRRSRGFAGGYWTTCGECRVGISFWENQEDLEGSRQTAEVTSEQLSSVFGILAPHLDDYAVVQSTDPGILPEAGALRLSRVHFDTQRIDDAAQYLAEHMFPTLHSLSGFRGADCLANRRDGRGILLFLFEDPESLDKCSERLNQARMQMLETIGARAVTVGDHRIVVCAKTALPAYI